MVQLQLNRFSANENCTIGELVFNNEKICNTLEPRNCKLSSTDSREKILSVKKKYAPKHIAIPYGTYGIALSYSPKFSHKQFYKSHGALLPRLYNVPGFSGIRIHCGNRVNDTAGCILVGEWAGGQQIYNSRKAFLQVLAILKKYPITQIVIQ